MPLTPQQIMKPPPDDGSTTERIAHRSKRAPITIVEYNPCWPQAFEHAKSQILSSLAADAIQEINHAGSTSVPRLPAKNIIDIDLVVSDIHDESAYVPGLEALGFRFLLREPGWNEHRFFVHEDGDFPINLHVFPQECIEVARHNIFRDWLRTHPEDRELYAKTKREVAEISEGKGEDMNEYSKRKEGVIDAIIWRAFRAKGWVA